ncbi:Origin recognition complex subunit 5 [Lobulomyces angularis]|nr:Origin recognition complex subunit 5 [Lobulomyces angularis]
MVKKDEFFKLEKLLSSVRTNTSNLSIKIFTNWIKNTKVVAVPFTFIYGQPSTGKTFLVKKVIENVELNLKNTNRGNRFSFVDVIQCFNQKLMFETIINQFKKREYKFEKKYLSSLEDAKTEIFEVQNLETRIDDFNEFVFSLNNLVDLHAADSLSSRYIVRVSYSLSFNNFYFTRKIIDNAQILLSWGRNCNILRALPKIYEMTKKKFGVVLISNQTFDNFQDITNTFNLTNFVHFKNFTKDEMLAILLKEKPYDVKDDNLYLIYLNLIIESYEKGCRDLRELRYISKMLFEKYIDPVKNGKILECETFKLHKNFEKTLESFGSSLYLRDISSLEWENRLKKEKVDIEETRLLKYRDQQENGLSLELPYYSKFLLFASFLASFNPPKFDQRYFTKLGEGKKRTKGTRKSTIANRINPRLLGPKSFPVERMLAIFQSILPCPEESNTSEIQFQIKSLCNLKLLLKIGGLNGGGLDIFKLKCNIGYQQCKNLGKTDFKYLSTKLKFEYTEYHSRKLSFYGQTNEQAEKLIQDGTAKKFCSNYDIILVADVNPDARFILKSIIEGNCFIKKLIFITTNRFDFNLFNEDKEMYYELVRKGHYPNKSGAEIIWVQNNPWEAKYCEIKLGGNYQDFTLIRPFGYSNLPEAEPISEEEAQLPAIHDHGFTKVFTKMVLDSGIKVRILPALYGGPSKVAQYKALLFFPYQTSTMKLYENLSQGVVTYVPTPRLLKEMIVIPGFDIDDHKHLANCINSGLKDWFNYIEVYNEDLSRFFYQFDTLEELKVLLSNPDVDPLNVRENGKRYYEEANAISLLKWSKVLGIKHNGM